MLTQHRIVHLIAIAILPCLMVACGGKKKSNSSLPSERAAFHNNRAVTYISQGELNKAEFELKTALELNSKYPESYNNLGIVYRQKGMLDKAIPQFEKAIALDPRYAAPHSHLGATYLAKGDYGRAIDALLKAIKIEPTYPDALYNLGLVYVAKGPAFDNEAEKYFKRATDLNQAMEEAHIQMGHLYFRQGKYELAAIRYRLALDTSPNNPDIWVKLGESYAKMGDQARAQNAFAKAKRVGEEGSESSQLKLGDLYYSQGHYQQALEEYQSALEFNPVNATVLVRVGMTQLALSQLDQAHDSLTTATTINPSLPDAYYNLGLIGMRRGNMEEAISQWNKTLALSPQHPQTLYNLGTVYLNQNDTGIAGDYFCRFLKAAKNNFEEQQATARQHARKGCR